MFFSSYMETTNLPSCVGAMLAATVHRCVEEHLLKPNSDLQWSYRFTKSVTSCNKIKQK